MSSVSCYLLIIRMSDWRHSSWRLYPCMCVWYQNVIIVWEFDWRYHTTCKSWSQTLHTLISTMDSSMMSRIKRSRQHLGVWSNIVHEHTPPRRVLAICLNLLRAIYIQDATRQEVRQKLDKWLHKQPFLVVFLKDTLTLTCIYINCCPFHPTINT
jgi:hypothetical protein